MFSMITNILINVLEIVIGFSSGIAVGCGFIALIMMLQIIPRLIQLTNSSKFLNLYTSAILFGEIFGSYISFVLVTWNYPLVVLILWGAFHGIFNGMLVAALAEVLNVFPILFRRIGMERYHVLLLMAFLFGKIGGSLFQWLFFIK